MGEGAKGCAARRKVAMIEDLMPRHFALLIYYQTQCLGGFRDQAMELKSESKLTVQLNKKREAEKEKKERVADGRKQNDGSLYL